MGKIKSPTKILEWGGGYGNMCKVMNMVYGNLIESYTIIDLPKFTTISERYISNVCETMNHNHFSIDDFKDKIESKYDMFLSTWALSESPSSWTDYMVSNSFFGVSKFLIALHQCGFHISFMEESTKLRNELKFFDVKEQPVTVLPVIVFCTPTPPAVQRIPVPAPVVIVVEVNRHLFILLFIQ